MPRIFSTQIVKDTNLISSSHSGILKTQNSRFQTQLSKQGRGLTNDSLNRSFHLNPIKIICNPTTLRPLRISSQKTNSEAPALFLEDATAFPAPYSVCSHNTNYRSTTWHPLKSKITFFNHHPIRKDVVSQMIHQFHHF